MKFKMINYENYSSVFICVHRTLNYILLAGGAKKKKKRKAKQTRGNLNMCTKCLLDLFARG